MKSTRAVLTAAVMACVAATSVLHAEPAPRTPTPKTPTDALVMPEHATGRLLVKFTDASKVRLDGTGGVRSLSNTDTGSIERLIRLYRLDLDRVWGDEITDAELQALQVRAQANSGKAQPDLGGVFRIEVDAGVIEAAARRLNDHDLVEWVQFEQAWRLGGSTPSSEAKIVHPQDIDLILRDRVAPRRPADPAIALGATAGRGDLKSVLDAVLATVPGQQDDAVSEPLLLGATGACCLADGTCVPAQTNNDCLVAGGTYVGDGTVCTAGECGSCCTGGGCLVASSPQDCTVFGGTFSAGVLCADLENPCTEGLCCLSGTCTPGVTEAACVADGGTWLEGTECEDDTCENENCGDVGTGNCFDPLGNASPYCDDDICCNLVCNFDDTCCDENDPDGWDSVCAAIANLLCDPHTPNPGGMAPYLGPDRCNSSLPQGSCFQENDLGGCDDKVCCNLVCGLLPPCCEQGWGADCIGAAQALCLNTTSTDPDAAPPDLVPLQSYLTGAATHADVFDATQQATLGIPIDPVTGAPVTGWDGSGYDLIQLGEYEVFDDFGADGIDGTGDAGEGNGWWDLGEPWDDTYGLDGIQGNGDPGEGDAIWNAPRGFWGVAEELRVTEDLGSRNGAFGVGIDVAVIGPSYVAEHYELIGRSDPNQDGDTSDAWPGVISEPGQVLIRIPDVVDDQASTGMLSVIASRETADAMGNRSGIVGIARECQPRFFPIASVNQGPREQAAWFRAIETLGPGDVITTGYQPGAGTFNSTQFTWDLIRLASDIGITVAIPGGDTCTELDNTVDLGDSGAIICGAGSPGTNTALGIPYRLVGSNFNIEVDLDLGTTIHQRAWGTRVVAASGGELYQVDAGDGKGERRDLSYTNDFSGTISAAAQIAALAANAQGFAEQIFSLPLPTDTIRIAFGGPGTPPPTPAPAFFGGWTQQCFLDLDPQEGPHWCGAWTALGSPVAQILLEGGATGPPIFEDAPNVTDLIVVRGDLRFGNVLSIKGDDESYLNVDGEFTDRNFRPGPAGGSGTPGTPAPPTIPEVAKLDYLFTGQTVDLVVVAVSDEPAPDAIEIESNMRQPNEIQVLLIESYDRFAQNWAFIDAQTLLGPFAEPDPDGNGEVTFISEAVGARRYIDQDTQRILVRLYYVTFPGFSDITGGPQISNVLLDLVDVRVTNVFSEG